ncbi:MAG TPA: hypothetical protein DEA26_10965 [Oceanospirillales bacterium]|nr:hypothetical protein [Oceanospirillaceae bacterium]HBS43194.1 hypothetical protein [Oceanospirillales bacterium]|tara:strand:- start:1562 stop:1777 length:216 start_codon:yes stop_codon:yes gene_type:complete
MQTDEINHQCDDCNDTGVDERYAIRVYCECLAGKKLWKNEVDSSIQAARKTLGSLKLQREALNHQIRRMEQ